MCVINVVLQVSGQDELVALGALLPDLEVTLRRPLGVDGAEVLVHVLPSKDFGSAAQDAPEVARLSKPRHP